MSCNRQQFPAAICGFIERVTGDTVSQADWHGLVKLASERGYRTGRTRVEMFGLTDALNTLGRKEGRPDAAAEAIANAGFNEVGSGYEIKTVEGKYPSYTQNMSAVAAMLAHNGVAHTLAVVRSGDDPQELATLACDADPNTRAVAAGNPRTPDDVIRDLAIDDDFTVSDVASKELRRRGRAPWDAATAELRARVGAQKNIDGEGISTGAVHVPTTSEPRRDVRSAASGFSPRQRSVLARLGKQYAPGYEGSKQAAKHISMIVGREVKVGDLSSLSDAELDSVTQALDAFEREANPKTA
jgi:hypothetical protein